METMSEGVIALDSQNTVRMINQAAQRLLGTDSDARGRPLAEIERDFEMLQVASRSADTRRMRRAQIELLHPRRFVTVTATPLSGGVGHGGALLTLQDATDERPRADYAARIRQQRLARATQPARVRPRDGRDARKRRD